MSSRFPLATTTWDQAEYDSLQRVIDSGMFSMGSEVATFEAQFASFFGSKYAVMVNSGSSANLLMTSALFYSQNPDLQLRAGDEVIVRKQSSANNGDIVIALTSEDEATCKRFYREDNYYRLQPENDSMNAILLDEVIILGKVVSLYRSHIF